MNEAERIEDACADAWPAQVEQRLGRWRVRAAGGFTGRANSALGVGDPGTTVETALIAVCEFSHEHGIDPMVQALVGDSVEDALAAAGWRPYREYANGHEVSVLVGAVPHGGSPGKVRMLDSPTPGWWELTAGTTRPDAARRHVLAGGAAVGFGVAEIDGTTAGAVRASVAGDVLLVARLAVRPEYRRRGLGTALMTATGAWAEPRGATRCVLQVAVTNTVALALYAGLGFTEHHRYRYWVPGQAWKDRAL